MERVSEEVRLFVGEDEYTSGQLLVVIPNRYKDLFDGARFEDMHHLSQALGAARIAQEARRYDNPFKTAYYEHFLLGCIKKEETT